MANDIDKKSYFTAPENTSMILFEILAFAINEFLKKTMKNRESISLYHYLKSLKSAK